MENNLISTLSKYAFRQEENFLSESFVFLLKAILERDAPVGLWLLNHLSGESTRFSEPQNIQISTQWTTEEGKPDIIIRYGEGDVFFVEVKLDSALGVDQLERYFSHLQTLDSTYTRLILLTRSRHSIQETSLDRTLFHHVCWYEISGWLSEADIQDEVVDYLTKQFLDFMKEKEMSMEKVTWEYMEGVPAMFNLANMLGTAIAEVIPEVRSRRTAGWNWIGYYLGEGTDLWVGMRYREPLKIIFENNNGTNPTFQRELLLLNAHFFSLSAGEQLECLINFVRKSHSEYMSA